MHFPKTKTDFICILYDLVFLGGTWKDGGAMDKEVIGGVDLRCGLRRVRVRVGLEGKSILI